MSKKKHSNDQNFEIKTKPQLLIMKFGKPWCLTTIVIITFTNPKVLIVTLTCLKCTIFITQSIITKIKLYDLPF